MYFTAKFILYTLHASVISTTEGMITLESHIQQDPALACVCARGCDNGGKPESKRDGPWRGVGRGSVHYSLHLSVPQRVQNRSWGVNCDTVSHTAHTHIGVGLVGGNFVQYLIIRIQREETSALHCSYLNLYSRVGRYWRFTIAPQEILNQILCTSLYSLCIRICNTAVSTASLDMSFGTHW